MIAYYVTAHGYGHGVRSCDIIRALHEHGSRRPIMVISDLPPDFFDNRLPGGSFAYRPGSFDTGMVQLDSIRVDVQASLEKAEQLCARRVEMVVRESEFLRKAGAGLVVADIPAIPLEAAARAGIPGVAVGNFSWDWIYAGYLSQDARWAAVARAFAEGYARAKLLLRLPFHAEMDTFLRIEDVPLLASPGRNRRAEMAELTGASQSLRWILLSFTTLEWDEDALNNVDQIEGYEFFTVRPLGWARRRIHAIDRKVIAFSDVVASVDAVLSKPGYGILSDCIANRKPLIYAEREDFGEYAILEAAIRRYLRHVHLPADRLYRGELSDALLSIDESPEAPEALPLGGAAIAACRLLSFH
jgi:hypothetical protein